MDSFGKVLERDLKKESKNSCYVTVPKWLLEDLFELAQETMVNNKWKRDTTKRNNALMLDMDKTLRVAKSFLGT